MSSSAATSSADSTPRSTATTATRRPAPLSTPLTTSSPTALTLRQLCDAPLHLILPPPPAHSSTSSQNKSSPSSHADGSSRWANVPLLSLFFWRHSSNQCHDSRQLSTEHTQHAHMHTTPSADSDANPPHTLDHPLNSNTDTAPQTTISPSSSTAENSSSRPPSRSAPTLTTTELAQPPLTALPSNRATTETATETDTHPDSTSPSAIYETTTQQTNNHDTSNAGALLPMLRSTHMPDAISSDNIAVSGVRVEVDARVWRDVSWSQLRRKVPHRDLFLSGLQCAVRLRASNGTGGLGEADVPGLHALYKVDHVWTITPDCKMFHSPLTRSLLGVMESDEGPDWDPGECVDVVVRVVSTATQQMYLVHAPDVSISVEVVFHHRWELFWSLAALWWGLLAQPAILLLRSVREQGLRRVQTHGQAWARVVQGLGRWWGQGVRGWWVEMSPWLLQRGAVHQHLD